MQTLHLGVRAVTIGGCLVLALGCLSSEVAELWPRSSQLLMKAAECYEQVAHAVWLKSRLIRNAAPQNHRALPSSLTSHIELSVSTLTEQQSAASTGLSYAKVHG